MGRKLGWGGRGGGGENVSRKFTQILICNKIFLPCAPLPFSIFLGHIFGFGQNFWICHCM